MRLLGNGLPRIKREFPRIPNVETMNARVLAPVLLPLAAFAAGWWMRGGTETPRVGSGPAASGRSGAPRTTVEDRPAALPTKRFRSPAEEAFTEADRLREAEDRRRMEERCRSALERRIAEWRRLLDLGAGEVAALQGAVGSVVAATDPPVASLALPLLEERLRSLLDQGRVGSLDQLASRRGEAAARAKVLARLAELNAVLLLDPDQERRLEASLLEQGGRLSDPAEPSAAGLSPADAAEIARRLADAGDDGSGYAEVARDVIREGIEADLQPLAGVLTPDQLESYRAHLEEKHAGWLADPP